VAEQEDPRARPGELGVAMCARWVQAPLEHVARNHVRAGDQPVERALAVGADVDQQRAVVDRRVRLRRRQPVQFRARRGEQLIDRRRPGDPVHGARRAR
jgi:hypothetical protein